MYIVILSAQTDSLRRLTNKKNEWIWTQKHIAAFESLKAKSWKYHARTRQNNRSRYKRTCGNTMARAARPNATTHRPLEHFHLNIYGKPEKLITPH